MQGVVKFFSKDKGYGFICPDGSGKDIFVHCSDIIGDEKYKTLIDGQHVEFEVEEGARGLKAKNVKMIVPGD